MNLVVIVESMRTIVTHKADENVNALHVPSLIAVGAALGAFRPFLIHTSSTRRLTADSCRREVRAIPVLHTPPTGVEPSRGPLGGPPERSIH